MSESNHTSPNQLGYRRPAEWELHASTWLTWPRPEGISFPDRYETIPPTYAEFIRHLVKVEEVNVSVWDADLEEEARKTLIAHQVPLNRVRFHRFQAYEPWCRDYGPMFLSREGQGRRERAVVDWEFNAWGGKYSPCDLDDAIPERIAQARKLPLFRPPMVLEGGSIDVNGRGTLLTTESCLLHASRNPLLDQKEISQVLRDYLGVTHILWLSDGLAGDDADGQVDAIARFLNPTTVAIVVEDDVNDANYPALQENMRRLRGMRDQDGRLLRVVKLPTPGVVEFHAHRLPASYANFYIANGLVLVPTFRTTNDSKAIEVLQREFPYHRVVGIECRDLIWGLSALHGIAQEEPA